MYYVRVEDAYHMFWGCATWGEERSDRVTRYGLASRSDPLVAQTTMALTVSGEDKSAAFGTVPPAPVPAPPPD